MRKIVCIFTVEDAQEGWESGLTDGLVGLIFVSVKEKHREIHTFTNQIDYSLQEEIT